MAAQPSDRPEMQCCICEDEFSNVVDLAAHLIRHAEDSAYQEGMDDNGIQYEEPVVADPPTPYKSSYPEYTTMTFDKVQNSNSNPPSARASSPIVLEINSDSDDDDAAKQSLPPAPMPQVALPPPVSQSNYPSRNNVRRGRQGSYGGRGQR